MTTVGVGDWARVVSSNLPGKPGWDHLGPDGGPINSQLQRHMSDATNDDRKHWTGFAIAAARGGYWTGDESTPGSGAYYCTHPNDPWWNSTPQRKADHDRFVSEAHGYNWEYHSSGSFNPIKAIGSAVSTVTHAIEKIPVVGNVVHIVNEAASAPVNFAKDIASGERLDHALIGQLKDQLKIVKDVAPYAQTVVSFIPGIGTGAAAAIAAGAALAEGQSITQAAKAAIRGAIPGGAIAQTAFDAATKIASGENVGKAALETARNALPAGPAQKAFDVGVAVATGEKIQNALASGIAGLAPEGLQAVLAAGQKAISSTPGLATALQSVPPGMQQQGFQLAAGLLGHEGVNETALKAARSRLPPAAVPGFDAALRSQIPHTAWLANVVSAPPARPVLQAPPAQPVRPALHAPVAQTVVAPPAVAATVVAPPAVAVPGAAQNPLYGPYPQAAGTVSGPAPWDHLPGLRPPSHVAHPALPALHPRNRPEHAHLLEVPFEVEAPPQRCQRWSGPIAIDQALLNVAMAALGASGGRPTVAHGPNGRLYRFAALPGGALDVRICAA